MLTLLYLALYHHILGENMKEEIRELSLINKFESIDNQLKLQTSSENRKNS